MNKLIDTGVLSAVVAVLTITGCSSASHTSSSATSSSTTTAQNPVTTTSSGTARTSTRATSATGASSSASFSAIAGTYTAGTADGGWLYLRSDGATRLRAPDTVACPSCSTADAPIASIDLSLTSISGQASSGYRASGKVTATSDPTWATQISPAATLGSPVSLTVDPHRRLSLDLLPQNDVLNFTSSGSPPSSASPCTVAAVSPPVQAADPGVQTTVNSVNCSADGEWAAAQVARGSGSSAVDEVVVLAGNGATWTVVDRPTVCNHHDVTPSFEQMACGTS